MEQEEAKMEQQEEEMERQSQESARLREQTQVAAWQLHVREQALEGKLAAAVESKVGALQSRVEALHAAQLLTDDELYSLEDIIADGCEVMVASGGEGPEDRVGKMIALSEMMAADGAFSRQLRRKFAQ